MWHYSTGFFKANAHIDQKKLTCTGSLWTPCINVANQPSQWWKQEWLCFCQGSTKHCFHTTLKLGDTGCLALLARIQVVVCFFQEPSSKPFRTSMDHPTNNFCFFHHSKEGANATINPNWGCLLLIIYTIWFAHSNETPAYHRSQLPFKKSGRVWECHKKGCVYR